MVPQSHQSQFSTTSSHLELECVFANGGHMMLLTPLSEAVETAILCGGQIVEKTNRVVGPSRPVRVCTSGYESRTSLTVKHQFCAG
jgi:hypothetical protein